MPLVQIFPHLNLICLLPRAGALSKNRYPPDAAELIERGGYKRQHPGFRGMAFRVSTWHSRDFQIGKNIGPLEAINMFIILILLRNLND